MRFSFRRRRRRRARYGCDADESDERTPGRTRAAARGRRTPGQAHRGRGRPAHDAARAAASRFRCARRPHPAGDGGTSCVARSGTQARRLGRPDRGGRRGHAGGAARLRGGQAARQDGGGLHSPPRPQWRWSQRPFWSGGLAHVPPSMRTWATRSSKRGQPSMPARAPRSNRRCGKRAAPAEPLLTNAWVAGVSDGSAARPTAGIRQRRLPRAKGQQQRDPVGSSHGVPCGKVGRELQLAHRGATWPPGDVRAPLPRAT
jgi:hypothetical protein